MYLLGFDILQVNAGSTVVEEVHHRFGAYVSTKVGRNSFSFPNWSKKSHAEYNPIRLSPVSYIA